MTQENGPIVSESPHVPSDQNGGVSRPQLLTEEQKPNSVDPTPSISAEDLKKSQIPSDDDVVKKYQNLAKQEKRLREERKKAKEAQRDRDRFQQLKGQAKEDPIAVLNEFGVSWEDVFHRSVAALPEEQDNSVEARLNRFEKRQEEKERLAQEASEKARQEHEERSVLGFKAQISEVLRDTDKFELLTNLRADDAQDLVYEVVEAVYQQSRQVLHPEEAAARVEAYLESEAQKVLKLKKFGRQVTQVPEQEAPELGAAEETISKKEEPTRKSSKRIEERYYSPSGKPITLSNEMHSSPPRESGRPLSVEESKRQAAVTLQRLMDAKKG